MTKFIIQETGIQLRIYPLVSSETKFYIQTHVNLEPFLHFGQMVDKLLDPLQLCSSSSNFGHRIFPSFFFLSWILVAEIIIFRTKVSHLVQTKQKLYMCFLAFKLLLKGISALGCTSICIFKRPILTQKTFKWLRAVFIFQQHKCFSGCPHNTHNICYFENVAVYYSNYFKRSLLRLLCTF